MNKLIIFIAILLFSCKKDSNTIDATKSLKEIPEAFFTPNTSYEIQGIDKISNFTSEYSRFQNTEFSKFYLKKHSEKYAPYFNITLNLSTHNKITFEGVETYKNELISYLREFSDFAAEGKPTLIHLNFDENISLKSYLEFIKFIKPISSESIQINKTVFIYNVKSLPDCDCSL
jgi:hypothetical protein